MEKRTRLGQIHKFDPTKLSQIHEFDPKTENSTNKKRKSNEKNNEYGKRN